MLSISDNLRKALSKKAVEPLIGIDVSDIGEYFSATRAFASDAIRFYDKLLDKPKIKTSIDELGGNGRRGGLKFSVNNAERFSDILATYPDPENSSVKAYLYPGESLIAKYSHLCQSSNSSYINIPYNATLKPSLPITMSAWVMFTSDAIGVGGRLFANDHQDTYSGAWVELNVSGKIAVHYGDNTGTGSSDRRTKTGTTTISANQWYHILVVVQGSTNMQIYINGSDDGGSYSGTGGALAYGASKPSTIGVRGGSGGNVYANAYLTNEALWDVALSSADATALYNGGVPNDLTLAASYDTDRTANLLLYLTHWRGYGDTIDDKSSTGADGTVTNGAQWSQLIPLCIDSDRLQIFEGIIAKPGKTTDKSMDFECDPQDKIIHKKIGTLLDDDDAALFYLPKESAGKIRPIIYGDHRYDVGYPTKTRDTTNKTNSMTPCRYLGMNASGNHEWFIADHVLEEALVSDHHCQFWGYDPDLDRFVKFAGTISISNLASGAIVTHENNPTYYDYVEPRGTVTVNKSGTGTNFANPTRINDGEFDNESIGSIDDGASIGDYIEFVLPFQEYDNQGIDDADIIAVTLGWYGKLRYLNADNSYIKIENVSSGAVAMTEPDGAGYPNTRIPDSIGAVHTKAGIERDETIRMTATLDHGVDDISYLDVYEAYKIVEYQPGKVLDLFFGGRGMEYGTWIESRTGTETHADNDQTNELIENAAGVIESILRDILGLGDTNIDKGTFNVSSVDLSTSKLSFAILDQVDSRELIDKIAKVSKSAHFFSVENKAKMKVFVDDPFSASGEATPQAMDIYEYEPNTTFKVIDGENDQLKYSHPTPGVTTIDLDAGDYTGATLASHLETKLNAWAVGHTVTYSGGKFTIGTGASGSVLYFEDSTTTCAVLLGFKDSQLTGSTSYTGDYAIYADSFYEHNIIQGSLALDKSENDIVTNLTVKYGKRMDIVKKLAAMDFSAYIRNIVMNRDNLITRGDDGLGLKTNVTDNTYHAETISEIFDNDYTKDSATADITRDFLKERLRRKHQTVKFRAGYSAIIAEPFDIINIRSPKIKGIYTESVMNTKKWIVLSNLLNSSGDYNEIKAVEY